MRGPIIPRIGLRPNHGSCRVHHRLPRTFANTLEQFPPRYLTRCPVGPSMRAPPLDKTTKGTRLLRFVFACHPFGEHNRGGSQPCLHGSSPQALGRSSLNRDSRSVCLHGEKFLQRPKKKAGDLRAPSGHHHRTKSAGQNPDPVTTRGGCFSMPAGISQFPFPLLGFG